MKRYLLTVMSLLAFVFCTRAEVYTHETVPSPKVQGQHYYVANPDSVLFLETEQELNALCTRLNTNTGVEMAIVAINEYDTERYTSYGFALRLFNHWGIGTSEQNTGVLIFLARQERDIQIITGDGVAGMLTDGKCGELLDDNLFYFANNNFDEGMLSLCKDIEDFLMLDVNRGELMLGWSPDDTIISDVFSWWIIIGFIILILMARLGYKRLKGKPGQSEENVLKRAQDAQMGMGCLCWFFPIPMLFLYLFYKFFPKHAEVQPMNCNKCGHVMERVPMKLSEAQLKEMELKVYAYEKWHCPECGAEQSVKQEGRDYYKYSKCSSCGGRTAKLTNKHTVESPTVFDEGLRIDTYICQCCGHVKEEKIILPRKRILTGGSSSDDSDGGGGSGSWGGGSSSGGGAGRSF